MNEVPIAPIPDERIRTAIGSARYAEFHEATVEAREKLIGSVVWNINSTARGGGVAEMLQSLLAYARGLGVDARWLVMDGNPGFFDLTKRLHNNLHGHSGDGGPLGDEERRHYEFTLADNLGALSELIRPKDVVVCHDPQTAGLVPTIRKLGAKVIWRCHIGHNALNELVTRAWDFLTPYIQCADRYVFTRAAFVPPQLDRDKTVIIQPSIDPLSPKNQPLAPEVVQAILVRAGILDSPDDQVEPRFTREDGSVGYVERCADVMHLGRPPRPDRPLIVQVSRWDQLKDPLGVIEGFTKYIPSEGASLVLAGPNVSAVADDPEGGHVLDMVQEAWRSLPHDVRKHVHIACLPMADREENGALVNALQRHASIVVQKSLFEGFGLTVTEAMWKGRPLVVSAVGGIQDQIENEVHGLLIDDPADLRSYANALKRLIHDPTFAHELGRRARKRVEQHFLFTRHLHQYFELFGELLDGKSTAVA